MIRKLYTRTRVLYYITEKKKKETPFICKQKHMIAHTHPHNETENFLYIPKPIFMHIPLYYTQQHLWSTSIVHPYYYNIKCGLTLAMVVTQHFHITHMYNMNQLLRSRHNILLFSILFFLCVHVLLRKSAFRFIFYTYSRYIHVVLTA